MATDPSKTALAVQSLIESCSIESCKDSLDMMVMMDIIHTLTGLVQKLPSPDERAAIFQRVVSIALTAANNVRSKFPLDGNVGAFLKCVAELGVYANELQMTRRLLKEAVPLFKAEKSMDCSGLVAQCESIITLIDRKIGV